MSIPLIVLDVHADGTVAVTVDGTPLDPDPAAGPWRRSSFGQIIDRASTGTARALIDPARLGPDAPGGVVEVLLVGRISGTTIIRRLP